jgi:hypothetical protein
MNAFPIYKNILITAFFLSGLAACQKQKERIYEQQPFTAKINLNQSVPSSKPAFKIRHLKGREEVASGWEHISYTLPEWNEILYHDTLVKINPGTDYPDKDRVQFSFGRIFFLNPQKTSLIAELNGPYNMGHQYFVMTDQHGILKSYSLKHLSGPNPETEATDDLIKINNHLIINDYLFDQKAGRAYRIKKIRPPENITR